LAYWGQIDYLGESGGWPAKGWAQGAFDISLQPKPIAYMLKSMFVDEPVVHIGVVDNNVEMMWNGVQVGTAHMSEHWNRKDGELVSLYTYTNCEEVEVYVNGKSQGVKKNLPGRGRNKLKWDGIKFLPGYVEAVGRRNGKVVARHRIETSGKAKKIVAETDKTEWKADGLDLLHLRITAVDGKGRRVYGVNSPLRFRVEGDARIVAVDNGNIVSDEMHVANERNLFRGTALVILRAGRTPGEITLITEGDGFKPVRTQLRTN
jgi:beta-galactosidase